MMYEEIQLIKDFKTGNHESFEKLILKYRRNAMDFAKRYTHDPFIAEDIVQESFADIYVNRDRFKEGYSFKTYLLTIVKNKCIDYLRKKQFVPLDELFIASDNNLEEQIIANEKRDFIREKINELKRDYQVVIYLVQYEGFSYEETAKIMGKNLGQVKILIYRARKKLKALLEKEV